LSFKANSFFYLSKDRGLSALPFGARAISAAYLLALIAMQPRAPQMAPQPLIIHDTYHSNSSAYTLATVHDDDEPMRTHSPTTPLLTPAPNSASYGATFPRSPGVPPNSRKLIFNAALKMSSIFIISTLLLGGTLWIALPTLDE
jgi:hypothetical protein